MPKVSICIPTYNRKDYLKETLDSVFAQTYKDYEVVIVDDGSTDGTDEMVAGMSEPIRYFMQENAGDAAARNTLIKMAEGEYITFIDSDDLLYPDSVERLVKSVESHEGGACGYGGYIRIDENGAELPTKQKHLPTGEITIPLFQQILVHSCGSIFPKKAMTDKCGFNSSLRVCSDYETWLELSIKYKFIAQDEPTFKRRRHGNNLSVLSFDNLLTEHNVLENFYYNKGGKHIVPKSIAMPRLAKESYRVAMAAKKEDKGIGVVDMYLSQSVKRHFTIKTGVKLLGVKIQKALSK